MSEEHMCPRRSEGPAFTKGPDTWIERDGYPCCSFCGSLKPSAFFEAIEVGAELGPTDKSYKVYVDLKDPRAGELKVTGIRNSDPDDGGDWIKITEENLPEVLADGWGAHNLGHWMIKSRRADILTSKFYFQHLTVEEQQKFVDLINAKTMNIGYPGFFYATPFFIGYRQPA